MAYAENSKAHFDYEVLETFDGGIELLGFEVKSIRNGRCSLVGSRALIRGGELYVVGMKVDPYQDKNTALGYETMRTRKVLIHKKEIYELERKSDIKGNTLIPLSVYPDGKKIKIKIALCRGKKSHDKRETIKKRETERNLNREYKLR